MSNTQGWSADSAIECIREFARKWEHRADVPGPVLLRHLRAKQAIREAFDRAGEAEVLGGALNDACELLCGASLFTPDRKTPEEWRQHLIDVAARRREAKP